MISSIYNQLFSKDQMFTYKDAIKIIKKNKIKDINIETFNWKGRI